MSGTSYNNVIINLGDQATILGAVLSITGSAPSTASVTVTEMIGGGTFVCAANDCTVKQHDAGGTAMSMNGKLFTTTTRVSVNGRVTAISGSGPGALLTVLLDHSGLSVSVTAASTQSNGA
jgi:hypothetical protein